MIRTPVVLVGPSGGYRGLERTLVASLLERGTDFFEVDVQPENPGEPASFAEMVSRIQRTILLATQATASADAAERRLPALVGYSLGAQAAAIFASQHPGAVSSLSLIAAWAAPHGKMREVRELWLRLRDPGAGREFDAHELPMRLTNLVFSSAFGWSGIPSVEQGERAATEMAAVMHLCVDADLVAVAERIVDPVLVVGCAFDEFAPVNQSRYLFGAIPNARYAEIESGHLVCVERPAEVVSLVESFVADPQQYPAGTRVKGHCP